jgi:molybdopterin-guanine dinucleotide biosynthesis protein A/GNAT superfamily N-acetyltransferase
VAYPGLTGVLLVGGAGRRFGSPKATAVFEGETLAERGWRTLGRACAARIAVGKEGDRLPLPFEVVDDGTALRAALAGIVAGLRAAPTELVVVLPVDMPLVAAGDLERLAGACREAAVPQTGPLPCALRTGALLRLERRLGNGDLALRDAFAELDAQLVELDPRRAANVNTPAELAALEVRIVPFEREHGPGYRALVSDTLREFGFTPDADLDPDLDDPSAVFAAVWIASQAGKVVGSVALRRNSEGELQLKRMYLRPGVRGRGVGSRLLSTALAWSRARGTTVVRLDTTEDMRAARRLYEAYGFMRIAGDAPRQGRPRLLYELRL